MKFTRRLLAGVLGTGMCAWLFQDEVTANQDGTKIDGYVYDAVGKGIDGFWVQIIQPETKPEQVTTNGGGRYVFPAPKKGPFQLLFIEPQFGTRVLSIRGLKHAVAQTVSVTVDPTFERLTSKFDALNAVESIANLALTDETGEYRGMILGANSFTSLQSTISFVEKYITVGNHSASQVAILKDKLWYLGTMLDKLRG